MENTTLTLRDRKKAQPNAQLYFSDIEKKTIIDTVAKSLDQGQRNVFFYTCQALGLNPLLNEVCAVTYAGKMSIQVMRDGFLTIAHRSGKFAGLESGTKVIEVNGNKQVVGWAKVYHKDFTVPVYQEAELSEYTTGRNLWSTKPNTMIKKVAESMALRKAFNVNGVYAPEEMEKELWQGTTLKEALKEIDSNELPSDAQIATLKSLGYEWTEEDPMTKQGAIQKIMELSRSK